MVFQRSVPECLSEPAETARRTSLLGFSLLQAPPATRTIDFKMALAPFGARPLVLRLQTEPTSFGHCSGPWALSSGKAVRLAGVLERAHGPLADG
jgi:hypothetical protein